MANGSFGFLLLERGKKNDGENVRPWVRLLVSSECVVTAQKGNLREIFAGVLHSLQMRAADLGEPTQGL